MILPIQYCSVGGVSLHSKDAVNHAFITFSRLDLELSEDFVSAVVTTYTTLIATLP